MPQKGFIHVENRRVSFTLKKILQMSSILAQTGCNAQNLVAYLSSEQNA